MSDNDLIKAASEIRQKAYAPYSNYKVGAALLGVNSVIYTGVNIENSSYGLTVCAERSAVSAAIADACYTFNKIVVCTESSPPAAPCGACRQVLAEFGTDIEVICVNDKNERRDFRLSEMLPERFK